jgi:hypothetical protein
MAKGKKSSGKHYVSKGERRNISAAVTNAVRKDVDLITRALYKLDATNKKDTSRGPKKENNA